MVMLSGALPGWQTYRRSCDTKQRRLHRVRNALAHLPAAGGRGERAERDLADVVGGVAEDRRELAVGVDLPRPDLNSQVRDLQSVLARFLFVQERAWCARVRTGVCAHQRVWFVTCGLPPPEVIESGGKMAKRMCAAEDDAPRVTVKLYVKPSTARCGLLIS